MDWSTFGSTVLATFLGGAVVFVLSRGWLAWGRIRSSRGEVLERHQSFSDAQEYGDVHAEATRLEAAVDAYGVAVRRAPWWLRRRHRAVYEELRSAISKRDQDGLPELMAFLYPIRHLRQRRVNALAGAHPDEVAAAHRQWEANIDRLGPWIGGLLITGTLVAAALTGFCSHPKT